MSSDRPISEEELHAYVDQALDAARHAEVTAYLAQHPDVAARIEAYARQRAELRLHLQPIADEPVPPELNLRHLLEARRPRYRRPAWQSLAAALALLVLGGGGGWSLHDIMIPTGPAGMTVLAQEAADNFVVYGSGQDQVVELPASQRTQLIGLISNSLGHTVAIPDLSVSGYHFVGGRVVPTAHGPAAMLTYADDRSTRISVLIRPSPISDAPMTEHTMGRVCGYAWADKGIGYSLVSAASAERLHPIANEIRRQVNSAA